MVQQERARRTRIRILLAAADVIRRVGYTNASLGEIAEAAEVTKGALYFHFRSKDQIARALVEEQHRITREAAARVLATPAPALELMMRLTMEIALKLIDEPIVRAGLRLTTDSSTFESPVVLPYLDWIDTCEMLTTRAQAEGEVRPDVSAASFARFVIPAFTGIQLVSETFTHRADLPERVAEMWQFLILAIVPPQDTARLLAVAEDLLAEALQARAER